MLNFTRDYEIPKDGITDQFKINSYASFSMELLNMCKTDNKLLTVYEIIEFIGEKEYSENIDVTDEEGNISNAVKKVKKNVLSYTAVLTSNTQVIINGKRKAEKPMRILPNLKLEPKHSKPTKTDMITGKPKPPKPVTEKQEKKPKDHTEEPLINKKGGV